MFKLIVTILRGTGAAAFPPRAPNEEMRSKATRSEATRRLPRSKRNAILQQPARGNCSMWGGLAGS
jgi:hypothetical protein